MPTPGQPYRHLTGVVVSTGKMTKTVKVRLAGQEWHKRIRKHFPAPYHVLVSDPTESAREGDVVGLRNGWRTSKLVYHVVTSIISPFGPGVSERPPIPTEEERQQQLVQKRMEKDLRKAAMGRMVSYRRLKEAEKEEGWLEREISRIRELGQNAVEARSSKKDQQVAPARARARDKKANAARFTQKGLENEAELERAQRRADSLAEKVAKGEKAV